MVLTQTNWIPTFLQRPLKYLQLGINLRTSSNFQLCSKTLRMERNPSFLLDFYKGVFQASFFHASPFTKVHPDSTQANDMVILSRREGPNCNQRISVMVTSVYRACPLHADPASSGSCWPCWEKHNKLVCKWVLPHSAFFHRFSWFPIQYRPKVHLSSNSLNQSSIFK